MLNNAKELSFEKLENLEKEFKNNKINLVMQNAAAKNELNDLVYVNDVKRTLDNQFSINLKTLPVANQMASGRCWIFAGMNVLREIVAKKCNLDSFELSQNYVAYYDKLEKINYALESVIDLLDKDPDERTLSTVLHMGVGDGGQWDMLKNLVKKYGVAPKKAMEETFGSSHTRTSDMLINTAIRKFASDAQRLYKEHKLDKIQELKDEVFAKLYNLINVTFGTPVKEFDFEYTDKDGVYHLDKNLTPKEFYDKYVAYEIDDYVSLINAPTADKPFYKTFTVDYVGNVINGEDIFYLNVPMSDLKEAVIKQLKAGEPVWFGSDAGKYSSRDGGLWAPEQYDYLTSLDLDIKMDKKDMLDYAVSAMNHAMVITGVNLVEDKSTKWKIENSWGKDVANQGYYVASDLWFDRFVFQAVVNKKYLTKHELEALDQKPIHLNPWDPMGTLA